MKTAKIFIFVLIIINLIGCKTVDKTGENLPEIYIDLSNEQNYYDVSNDIEPDFEIVALETNDECMIGNIKKIIFANNQYYILNSGLQICIFDTQGRLINKLAKLGRGPNEYLSITSFAVIGKNVWIFDNTGSKIMCYDENLENTERIPFSNTVLDVESLGDNLFLSTNSVGYDKVNYQLYQYDTQKKETNNHLAYNAQDHNTLPIQKETQFAKQGDSCLFIYAHSNLIYDFHTDHIEPKYKFTFSERYEDVPVTFEDYSSAPTIIRGISCIKQTSNSIILEYVDNQRPKYSIYNKVNQQCTSYQSTMRITSLGGLYVIDYLIQDDYLIAYFLPEYLLNPMILDLNKIAEPEIKKKFESVTSKLNENDNPILIKFKLKPDSAF